MPLPQVAKGKILRQADFTINSVTQSILNIFSSMKDQNHRNTFSNRMHHPEIIVCSLSKSLFFCVTKQNLSEI